MEREIFAELMEGFEALALQSEGKLVLQTHKVLMGDSIGPFSTTPGLAVSPRSSQATPAPTPTAPDRPEGETRG